MSGKRKASSDRSTPSKRSKIVKEKEIISDTESEEEEVIEKEKREEKKEKKEKEKKKEKKEKKDKEKKKEKKDKKRKKEEVETTVSTPKAKSRSKHTFHVNRPPTQEVFLFACGNGDAGQLGMGPDAMTKKFATPIPTLDRIMLCDIKGAYMQTAILVVNQQNNTQVITWGCNDNNAAHVLGRDGEESEPLPVTSLDDKDIVQISVGQYHMTALNSSGKVYFWGSYKADEFIGPNTKKHQQDAIMYPELHPDLIGTNIKYIASAGNFTCAITESGELIEWGWTRRGHGVREVRNTTSRLCLTPSHIMIKDGKPQSMVCGHVHGIVFVADAKGNRHVASWGFNHHGQLGHGDKETRERPVMIQGLPKNIAMIACGEFHNIALTEDHKVYLWGRNSYCQLGNGDDKEFKDVVSPWHNTFFDNLPDNAHVVHVSCGSNHSLAVTNTGHVYGWGFGDEFQLGNGIENISKFPTLIKSSRIPATHPCLKTIAGSSFSTFVTVPPKQ